MRILNLLQENMASLESSLKKIILPSAYKAVRRFLTILLVASQLWINFNAENHQQLYYTFLIYHDNI